MRVHNLKGLRTLMVVREVSQRRLARAAGYRSHAYMGRILRGEVDTLEPEAAVRIARFLQVGVDFGEGKYRVMAWGKNVFNEFYITNRNYSFDGVAQYAGKPATYGITVSAKY